MQVNASSKYEIEWEAVQTTRPIEQSKVQSPMDQKRKHHSAPRLSRKKRSPDGYKFKKGKGVRNVVMETNVMTKDASGSKAATIQRARMVYAEQKMDVSIHSFSVDQKLC